MSMDAPDQFPTTVESTEDAQQRAANVYSHTSPLLSWQTRVLALHPGARGQPLIVDLHLAVITHKAGLGIVAEDRNETYEALSYTWGSQDFTHPLICDGQPIKITENLHDALQRLRRRQGKRYIWADAVCINQHDNIERARQVRNLQIIFERARRVIVWLGRAMPCTKKAIDFATLITSRAYRLDTNASVEKSWHEIDARLEVEKIFQGADPKIISAVLQGLLDLGQRAWMRRSWVIQEVHAANSISVRCGSYSIPWKAYTQIHNALKTALWYSEKRLQRPPLQQQISHFALPRRNQARAMHIWSVHRALQSESEGDSVQEEGDDTEEEDNADQPSMATLRSNCSTHLASIGHAMEYLRARGPTKSRQYSSEFANRSRAKRPEPHASARDLNKILLQSKHLGAQDDRDRVFALLGLTTVLTSYGDEPDVGNNGIAIDYNKSTSAVYQNVTRFFINKCQHLGPLYYKWAVEPTDDLKPLDLPSWTPDWRRINVEKYLECMPKPLTHPWDKITGSDIDLHLSCLYDKRAMRSSVPHWPGTYFIHSQDLNTTPDVLKLHGRIIGHITSIDDLDNTIRLHHSGVMNLWIMKAALQAHALPVLSYLPRSALGERQMPAVKRSVWLSSTTPKLNDVLAFVFGGLVPLVLRERDGGGHFCVGYAVPKDQSMLHLVSSSLLTASGLAIDEFDVY